MRDGRRRFISSAAAGTAAVALPAWSSRLAAQGNEIVVGSIYDASGPLQVFGQAKANVLKFAVDQTNAAGGLLGRKVRIAAYDTQSNNQLYAQFAQQVTVRDRANVVFAAVTSASREVIRPILRRGNTLYFYNMTYEGGVCDRNIVITGPTPSQSLQIMQPELIKRYGKKIYVLAADYNFGQISTKWIRRIAADHGAEVVGAELFPLDTSNFQSTIAKIQSASPDFIINSFVGPAHAAFYGQWAASGMKGRIPLASQTFGDAGELTLMPKEITEGIIICTNYYQDLDTPANKAFIERYRAAMGPEHISPLAMNDYVGWQIYTTAVTKAGSVERNDVLKALESGIAVDTPAGRIALDPATHHCSLDMHLLQVRDGRYQVLRRAQAVPSTELQGQCDLIKNPNTNQQFEPKI
ncbi:MAG TPA: ABC transporter substrate-binding protein [Burkholderiaceae bacterium]|nr:ABC transporter substrate-binding protein [Burkholderiaceae bacterium]